MKLGYFAMPLHPPGSDFTENIHADLDQVVELDRLGFQEAWIGEHYTMAWEPIPSPDLFIAMALARTENIVLGTGVSCLPNHNPFQLAHRIAQLDHMAKGRFMWGIGPGASPPDSVSFGIDAEAGDHRKFARLAVDAVIGIWAGLPPGDYSNEFWTFHIPEPDPELGFGVHLFPLQKPHPPIAVAGLSARSETLVVAGERGWIPMSINHVPARTLISHWEAMEEGAARTGAQIDRSMWRIARDVFIAPTAEEARTEALDPDGVLARDFNGYIYPVLSKFNYLDILKVDPEMPDEEVTLEYMVDNIWMIGSPADVEEKIRSIYDQVGGFGVLMSMHHDWTPKDKWLRSTRLLAEEVLPTIGDLG